MSRFKFLPALFLIGLAFGTLPLPAQNFYVRHFTVNDGLPASDIHAIFKDSRGLMWFGTEAGLCIYDGKEFQTVRTADGKTIDQVWSITEDPHGNLWFGSHGNGIWRYDGSNFTHLTTREGLSDNTIRCIYYSQRFDLVAACSLNGANIIKNDTILNSPEWIDSKGDPVMLTGIGERGDHLIFTSYNHDLRMNFFPIENKFLRIPISEQQFPESLSVFVTSKKDTLYGMYVKGVRIIQKDRVINDTLIGQVFNMSEDREGNIWLPAWSFSNRDLKEGIYRWDGEKMVNFQREFGITDKEIWSVCCDREQDIVWVGTLNDGLYQAISTSIRKFGPADFHLDRLFINGLFVDSGNTLWISSENDLIRMDPDGRFSTADKHAMVVEFRKYWEKPTRYVFTQIDSVQVSLRKLPAGLLARFERETPFHFKRVIENPRKTFYFSNRFGIFRFRNDSVRFCSPEGSEGLFDFTGPDTMVFTGTGVTATNPAYHNLSANLKKSSGPRHTHTGYSALIEFSQKGEPLTVNQLCRRQDQIWYASAVSGLWRSEGMKLTHFNESDSTISNNLTDICFDCRDHLIFGSNSGEICIARIIDDKLDIRYRINEEKGLRGITVNWLIADSSGHLWVGTNRGLNCIDLNTLYDKNAYSIRFVDQEDGYLGSGSKVAVMDRRGYLYIAAGSSLIRFDSRRFLSGPSTVKRVILRSFMANQEPVSEGATLRYTRKDLIFRFDVLNYINSNEDLFRFRLVGYDKDWSAWGNTRTANYTNLPAGRYRFRVESFNPGTAVRQVPLETDFTILPPFWNIWAFQVAVAVVLIFLIVSLTRSIVNRQRMSQVRKAETDRRMLQLEMQALQAQMNPHFIYNSLSGIQYTILHHKTDEAMDYLNDFSKVVRISMENSASGFIPFDRETEFLNSYLRLEQMRFPGKFRFEIIRHNVPPGSRIRIPSMILQPFAENSVRHGFSNLKGEGLLTIEFEILPEDILKCTLTDNGTGRLVKSSSTEPHPAGTRLHSTEITQMRIRMYNPPGHPDKFRIQYTDLTDNGLPAGLKVEIYLPVTGVRAED